MSEEPVLGSVARRLAATRRVLVVDDEHDIADFLRAYFRASGYDLVHVDPDTPLEVLDALDEHRPDCVLLDLNLRGFNGADAYRLLRSDERYELLPVVVVSARPDARELLHAVGGVDGFVTKPFSANLLADLVANRIAGADQLRATAVADSGTGLSGHEHVEARLAEELDSRPLETDRPPSRWCRSAPSPRSPARSAPRGPATSCGSWPIALERPSPPMWSSASPVLVSWHCSSPAARPPTLSTPCKDSLGAIDVVCLPGGASVVVRFGAGVAGYPEHARDADSLYMSADAALADALDSDLAVVVAI